MKQYKLSGQTLIEVLTSMSILSLVFVMGMMLFQQITGIHSPAEKQQTRMMVGAWLEEPIDPLFPFAEREIRGRRLQRAIKLYDQRRGVYEVEVCALWGQDVLERRRRIIQIRE